MYTAFILCAIGGGLLSANWLVAVSTALIVGAAVGRIPAEERMLSRHFGATYEAYKARTGALLPPLS